MDNKMPGSEKEKFEFIKKHSGEIKPITRSPEILQVIDEAVDFETIPNDRMDQVLEEFETKVFLLEKPEFGPDQKRILVEADNPGAYAEIRPLVSALLKDERCGSICAVMSGVAGKLFQKDFGDFSQIREKDKPVLVDILDTTRDKPLDIVIATGNAHDTSDSVAYFGSKSSLGAKRLFLVFESWGQPLNKTLAENRKNMDVVDGVFCNDEFAKEIIMRDFPEFSPEKVYSFGTPIIDSLDIEHASKYRKNFREKLGINEQVKVLAYNGCISSEAKTWYGSRGDIDEQTFSYALRQVIQLANDNPDNNFVFALRPHPRDPEKEKKYGLTGKFILPKNLSFKDAAVPLSMNEVAYGADIILSIFSTENLLAPLRGRKSVFLGFGGSDMGRGIIEKLYGKDAVKILSEKSPDVQVADSPENLGKCLTKFIDSNPGAVNPVRVNATQKIIDIVMESD